MSDPNYIYNRGLVGTARPTAVDDEEWKGLRTTRYGEQLVTPVGNFPQALSEEESYFVATNPTSGTGLVGIAASTAFDAAETFLLIRNTHATKKVYLHYLHLKATAAGTNGTTFGVTMTGDRGTSRFTSGGATIVAVNPNMSSTANANDVVIKAGPLVTTAASSDARLLGDYPLRTVIKVIGDSYLFQFGAAMPGTFCGVPLEGTTQVSMQIPCPPVVLGENDQFLLHDYAASQTVGAAFTMSLGFWFK
jgi:hypothetical protein